jgi:hypothetical protein
MKLECKLRNGHGGVPCVAPFINDYNVWDIPVEEWTPAVQQAVKHAYELGVEHAMSSLQVRFNDVRRTLCDDRQSWITLKPKES